MVFEDLEFAPDHRWESGFEGDRRIVLSRLGPYRRLFARPAHFQPRFFHETFELRIEDWRIPLESFRLGALCTVRAQLTVRFQPTLKYAREHLDHIDDLGSYIRGTYKSLLQDAAEQEFRELERAPKLESDLSEIEQRVEDVVHELLALRNIQSRARCQLETTFVDPDQIDPHTAQTGGRNDAIYIELLQRKRAVAERLVREQHAQEVKEIQLKLAHQQQLLELARQETELLRARRQQEQERIRAELVVEETRTTEHHDSEVRQREERIRHEARMREMELEADLAEKTRRAGALDDVETHLKREIELLAMERQRLLLEQEVQDVKVAKAKGWVINAKRRFPLGDDRNAMVADDAEMTPANQSE